MALNKIFSLKHIYFMNKSLLVSLPFLIISCGYGSFYEAILVVRNGEEGGTYTGVIEALKRMIIIKINLNFFSMKLKIIFQ